ncbi:D-aminoacyl-tRNA deacylase [Halomicrobium urmianum]|uniref:D-aminoacyl-tRNA deacylase n=1 Tax=Halomicrobium urmianum TaxID=1586233 RepID=UPI001CD96A5A|nr:D-aminoacyl-tRNA deacylase [Halomicrobium urmianum]
MLAVVVSEADEASERIGEQLLDVADWREGTDDDRPPADGGGTVYRRDGVELRTFEKLHIYLDDPADAFSDPDLLVFASRHAGETGPLLTAHHTGNFGPAEYGGEDGALARACPYAHRRVVNALAEHAPDGYEVGMEATHHGPSDVGVPSMFVEVGSGEDEWRDPGAARAVARAILDLADVPPDAPRENAVGRSPTSSRSGAHENGSRRHLVGLGGGHYAARFERVVRETDWSVGHVAPDWGLDDMGDPRENTDVIERAFEASAADRALLDGDGSDLREVVQELGYEVVGETWVRETTGVPLGLVERLESAVAPVDEGLRFGERARVDAADSDGIGRDPDAPEEFAVVPADGDLLDEAAGIDRDAARDAVAETALAFVTDDNGTRPVGPLALADEGDVDDVVDALADLLRRKYDAVERDGDAVLARETAFDPDLARQRGVPEGPKFGRLSAGEPVEVDGEAVRPADVTRERERRFTLRD